MSTGIVEIDWTFIFQLLIIALWIALFIGVPYFIYKKYKDIVIRLESIEHDLKSILAKDE